MTEHAGFLSPAQRADHSDSMDSTDPTALPLFATPAAPLRPTAPTAPTAMPSSASSRPGRVRGTFSLRATPERQPGSHPSSGPGERTAAELRPVRAAYGSGLDWELVAALRQQASDRLSAAL